MYGCSSTTSQEGKDDLTYSTSHVKQQEASNSFIEDQVKKFLKGVGAVYLGVSGTSDANFTEISKMSLKKGNRREVFGFHVHWNDNLKDDYFYNQLSAIAYFACELDPYTGGMKNEWNWKSTKIVDLAAKSDTRVYLTVINYTATTSKKNKIFLNNAEAQKNSLEVISDLLAMNNAHGVIIDFEGISESNRSDFTAYIQKLSERLGDMNKTVVVALPWNKSEAFDIRGMKDYVEYFIIMGKNYYYSGSEYAGPVAPLNGGDKWLSGSLSESVSIYMNSGVSKEKLILSLPYYGSKWRTRDSILPSKKNYFEDHLTYKKIKKTYPQKPQYDSISQSAYLNIPTEDSNTQIWYDDALTLGKKYDFINDNDLAGVGIWALGYDEGYFELWSLLEEKFQPYKVYQDHNLHSEETLLQILERKEVLKGLLFIVLTIIILGMFFSLRNPEVREFVFARNWVCKYDNFWNSTSHFLGFTQVI